MRWFKFNRQKGLGLIELLIGMALSIIAIFAIYGIFISQNRSYAVQNQVVYMQQNVRMAMNMIVEDIMMAGYDPEKSAGAGILAASSNSIQFTADLNGDNDTDDTNENITYSIYDSDGDGDLDLGKDTGAGNQLALRNINGLSFVYTLADDSTTSNPADPSQIKKVQVSLTARTSGPDPDYPRNSGYRQRTLTTMVILRNLQ